MKIIITVNDLTIEKDASKRSKLSIHKGQMSGLIGRILGGFESRSKKKIEYIENFLISYKKIKNIWSSSSDISFNLYDQIDNHNLFFNDQLASVRTKYLSGSDSKNTFKYDAEASHQIIPVKIYKKIIEPKPDTNISKNKRALKIDESLKTELRDLLLGFVGEKGISREGIVDAFDNDKNKRIQWALYIYGWVVFGEEPPMKVKYIAKSISLIDGNLYFEISGSKGKIIAQCSHQGPTGVGRHLGIFSRSSLRPDANFTITVNLNEDGEKEFQAKNISVGDCYVVNVTNFGWGIAKITND